MTAQWVHRWKQAGQAMRRVRLQELRGFKYEDNLAVVDALLQIVHKFGSSRSSSGLVEQHD